MICCGRNVRHQRHGGSRMIEMRRAQLSFGDGLIAEEVSDLREEWMKHADGVLADDQIMAVVYEALAKRHPKSRSRGRFGGKCRTPRRRGAGALLWGGCHQADSRPDRVNSTRQR